MLTHAGCVAYRTTDDEPLFVVVSSSDGKHWVLPKGHIEPGESPTEAALRELAEEAGVTGRIVAKIGREKYATEKEKAVVDYFLIEASGCRRAEEVRTVRWLNEAAAHTMLTFDGQKKALRRGAAMVADISPAAGDEPRRR